MFFLSCWFVVDVVVVIFAVTLSQGHKVKKLKASALVGPRTVQWVKVQSGVPLGHIGQMNRVFTLFSLIVQEPRGKRDD